MKIFENLDSMRSSEVKIEMLHLLASIDNYEITCFGKKPGKIERVIKMGTITN